MAVNLTEGTVEKMAKGEVTSEKEMTPVLQVTELKLVQSRLQQQQQEQPKQIFRLVLSDGTKVQQGLLDTSKNELVKTGKLQIGSIIQLTQFVCSVIQGCRIVIVVELVVIIEKYDIIGNPVPMPRPGDPVQSRNNQPGKVVVNAQIIPIAALNPYQGRWTVKARVTTKGELRHYNNSRGDGKVFSFDLLDADGGEMQVTCFNSVADQFYDQIEVGKVYLFSGGSLRPAQKIFSHLQNDYEIFLDNTSMVQPCFEDDISIPKQLCHFRLISEVEGMDNNSIVDVIGVVYFISPTVSIMRKNGTETQKRTLQLKDTSGRSVELTLWGNFCNTEGQRLQNLCDSGAFPVLAVKSGRVSDFNGKAVGTIPASQLFIDPDFPESQKLKEWFDKEGRNIPAVSISRELSSVGRSDIRKTITQIKDEKLGTSDKPDWITICATITFMKSDNFCYTACPIMIGDRPCNKKVTHNGDGKWRCDRCDQRVDECDYRYIIQFQILDHTGVTWVTAFQEAGEEIMGISAKDLYYLKYENCDDEKFAEIIRKVVFTKYVFKLKVKEETFSDERRVKAKVVKADKLNYSSESRFLLDMMDKLKRGDLSSSVFKSESVMPNLQINKAWMGNLGTGQPASAVGGGYGSTANQVGHHGNQFGGSKLLATGTSGVLLGCKNCGSSSHFSTNCPNTMNGPTQSTGGAYANKVSPGGGVGRSGLSPGRYGGFSRQHVGGGY